MKNLGGFSENYEEYVEKESKLYINMRKAKRTNILYAEEMKKSVIPNTILFYGSNGYGLGGIPKALLSKMAGNPDFAKYKFVICLRSKEMIRQMRAEGYRSLKFQYVELGTSLPNAFYHWMARAQYLVVDGVLPSIYIPREEQTYIQASFLYSGMNRGYKRELRYTARSMDYIKNILAADYVISPSELYTKEILQESFCVDSSYQGEILTCKSPVIERLNQMTEEQVYKETIREQGEKRKKEILVIGAEARGGIEIAKIIRKVSNTEEYKDCIFYIKPPQVGYRDTREWMEKKPSDNVKLLLNQTDILRWIKRCDIVVSDYGADLFYSIYSGKPTVLLDVAARSNMQSAFMKKNMSELPMASTAKELVKALGKAVPLDSQCVAELFSATLSSDLILDVLLGKTVEMAAERDSESICVFAAMGHQNKDVLVAWKEQLSKFFEQMLEAGKEVTLFCDEATSEFYLENIEKVVPKKVRVIYREPERIMTKPEMLDSSYLIRNFIFSEDIKEAMGMLDRDLNRRDLKRSMGNLAFDKAIYAGPFSAKFVLLFEALEAKKKYYWDQRNYWKALNVQERVEKDEMRFRNLCKLPELFETVLHWDETELDVLEKANLIMDSGKHQLIKNVFHFGESTGDEKEYVEPDTVVLRGQEYWVVSQKVYLDDQRDMQLIVKRADREHRKALFVTSASQKRLEDILLALKKLHEKNPGDVFYIFEGQKSCYKELMLLLSNMEMQAYVVLCSRYLPWDILREFSEYYCTFDTNDMYENLCRKYGVRYEKLF